MDKETAETVFSNFDQDGSGKVEKSELRTIVKQFHEMMGEPIDDAKIDEEIKQILKDVDTSGDGKIDKAEFVKFFTAPME